MRLLLSVTTQQLINYSINNSSSGSKSTGDSEAALQECTDSTGSACSHALLCSDAPNLVSLELGEPQLAIGPGRVAERRATVLGEQEIDNSAHFSPGGSSAQAQQAYHAIRAVSRAIRCDRHPERFMCLPPLYGCVWCYTWVSRECVLPSLSSARHLVIRRRSLHLLAPS